MSKTPEEMFDWHVQQAAHHVAAALHTYYQNERVALSPDMKQRLEEAQALLEGVNGA